MQKANKPEGTPNVETLPQEQKPSTRKAMRAGLPEHPSGRTRDRIGLIYKVSGRYLDAAGVCERFGIPELNAAIRAGEVKNMLKLERIARLPKEQQLEALNTHKNRKRAPRRSKLQRLIDLFNSMDRDDQEFSLALIREAISGEQEGQ